MEEQLDLFSDIQEEQKLIIPTCANKVVDILSGEEGCRYYGESDCDNCYRGTEDGLTDIYNERSIPDDIKLSPIKFSWGKQEVLFIYKNSMIGPSEALIRLKIGNKYYTIRINYDLEKALKQASSGDKTNVTNHLKILNKYRYIRGDNLRILEKYIYLNIMSNRVFNKYL